MNTKALRQKVLDLAIHGKLVPQNPNDESATVLLEKIRAEKAEKIKKGELKADKKDSFIFTKECEFDEDKLGKCSSGTRHKRHYEQFADGTVKDIEDEIPFEVPEGWAWCRLPSICRKAITDGTHNSPTTYDKGDFLYITAKNIKADKIDLSNVSYVSREIHEEIYNRCPPELNDVLLTKDGTIGEVAVNNLQEPFSLLSSVALIKPAKNILPWYIAYVLKSNYLQNTMRQSAKGVALKRIILEQINTFLIPLPPFAEQERIVLAIEQFYNKINILEESKSELQTAIKQTKSKILDLAIHGKLVPQDPNDEPAEKLLKRIATSDNRPYEKVEEGDIPFEIPPSWKWTTIKNIVNYIGDGDWIESKDQSDKGIRLIQTGNIGFGTFKDKEGKYHYISENTFSSFGCNEIFEGDILISRLPEPVGRACILPKLPERTITAVDCTIIRLNEELISKELFVYYTISNKYLELIKENCTGTTRLRISRSNLEKIFIPIPPLNEQKRILNRIKELFEALNKIVLNLV